jgi:uroporphyrinogen-III decarboxylase
VDGVIQAFKDEKFICGTSGGEVGTVLPGGMERGLMMLLTQPDVVRAATEHVLAYGNAADETQVHPDQDGVLWGADFGFKTGPFVSPAHFREFYLEANKARVRALHDRGQWVLKHCCGNLWQLLDFFVDIGYDCYQSIQESAGMDICKVKDLYGDKMTLWGGVSLENLQSGTPEDVRRDVRRAMECAKQGGRFILGASHSIAVGTKYDNYMAMLDEYHKLAAY